MRRSQLPAICEAGTCLSTYALGQAAHHDGTESLRRGRLHETGAGGKQAAFLDRKISTDQLCAHKF